MSKVGRKPIPFSSAKVAIKDGKIFIDGPKIKLIHELPKELEARIESNALKLTIKSDTKENREAWGMHRALLANEIKGIEKGFERKVKIVGLGFKAQLAGKKLNFSLGYSHKIDFNLPDGVDVEVDKTGQLLLFKSHNNLLLGNVCDKIRSLRPPEPYKGTGIMFENEKIIRKAGKTKASA